VSSGFAVLDPWWPMKSAFLGAQHPGRQPANDSSRMLGDRLRLTVCLDRASAGLGGAKRRVTARLFWQGIKRGTGRGLLFGPTIYWIR